jgi:ribonuclease P protein component
LTRLFFGKTHRLLKARDYQAVFDNNTLRASSREILCLGKTNSFSHPRLGVIVAKKNARRAVDRNRIKRIIREQFRLHQHKLDSIDLVVMARAGLDKKPNTEVSRLVQRQLEKIEQQRND